MTAPLTKPTYYSHYSQVPPEVWRWHDFSPQEIACRGTGSILIDPRAMDMLQRLRDMVGRPIIVNSGYRSETHNRAVGGARKSQHLNGNAFDIRMDNHHPASFIANAKSVGFKGIGTYPRQNFLHIDARETPAAWGNPFPERQMPFEVEPAKTRESLGASRTMGGGATATVGTAGQVGVVQMQGAAEVPGGDSLADAALEAVTEAQEEVQALLPLLDALWWVFLALTIAGIGLAIYARVDDFNKRRR